ncbi:hypothetical protein OKW30_006038 [Paraburkholderia sp. Clong3]|uniref:hypothetical protein n=1 Tax=Paraburkholderia sp. Clong3 TaxID=2991061 RepID=UPI003D1BAB8A
MANEIAKLTLTIDPEALKKAIGDGRLLELADTIAKGAVNQISAQIVDHVARAATQQKAGEGNVAAEVRYIAGEEGGFGTVPPRRRWGVADLNVVLPASPLQVVVSAGQLDAT